MVLSLALDLSLSFDLSTFFPLSFFSRSLLRLLSSFDGSTSSHWSHGFCFASCASNARKNKFPVVTMVLLRCSLSAPTSVALVLILRSVLAVCYFPNGEVSDNDYIPCPNSKACCPTDAYCLSNGLCWTALNFLFRASCSDQSWTSPDCAKYCLNGKSWLQTTLSNPS